MANLGQVKNGLARYIDREITAKMTGWQKWVFGAMAGVALNNTAGIFEQLKQMPVVKMLGVVDANDNIDMDSLYHQFKEQARKGPITFDVPMIGPMTLNEGDVDKIYNAIMGG